MTKSNVVSAAITAASKSNSLMELLDALIEDKCGSYLYHQNCKKELRKCNEETFKKLIAFDVSKIPENELQNPEGLEQEVILNNAFKSSEGYISSEKYREMFSSLIASTFDKRKYSDLHPSFPFVIQQLTPLDCKILFNIKSKKEAQALIFGYAFKTTDATYEDKLTRFYPYKYDGKNFEQPNLTNISIDNLLRLGLIEISDDPADNSLSPEFNIDDIRTSLGITQSSAGGMDGHPYRIYITKLGLSFIKVCT